MQPIHQSKQFHRHLETLLANTPTAKPTVRFARRVVPAVLGALGDFAGVRTAHLYSRTRSGSVRRVDEWGVPRPDLSEAVRDSTEPSPGSLVRDLPWVGETAAGPAGLFAIDPDLSLLVALFLDGREAPDGAGMSRLADAVSTLDYAIRQHLRRGELEDVFEQARAIQLSLLPAGVPSFGEFDIAATTVPARRVGGDLYDFLEVDRETLAIAIADAAGHGLPAALQARDVAIGLRMGAERDFKITRIIEKLNRIIHRSGLVTRFVSLVFGELELNGNFSYINAGHPPPLLLDDAGFHALNLGGMILGPRPDSLYKLGFAHVDRGAVLVFYSDGIVECGAERGRPFGEEGLRAWMEAWRAGPADRAVADLMRRLESFNLDQPFLDDMTVVFVRRPQ
jgi:hypothetical protein